MTTKPTTDDLRTNWPSNDEVPPHPFENTGATHMAAGLQDHLDHVRRLAARGERDES